MKEKLSVLNLRDQLTSLDVDRLRELEEFDEEVQDPDPMLPQLLNLFLEVTPPVFNEMKSQAEQLSIPEMSAAAHNLKSSASNIGAMILAKICQELEDHSMESHSKNSEEILRKIQKATAEYAQVLKEIEACRVFKLSTKNLTSAS